MECLPTIDNNVSTSAAISRLKAHFFSRFLTKFNPDDLCSYHYISVCVHFVSIQVQTLLLFSIVGFHIYCGCPLVPIASLYLYLSHLLFFFHSVTVHCKAIIKIIIIINSRFELLIIANMITCMWCGLHNSASISGHCAFVTVLGLLKKEEEEKKKELVQNGVLAIFKLAT